MGQTIPAGSQITVQVTGAQTVAAISGALNADDVMNAVSADLASQGFVVEQSTNSGGLLAAFSPMIQESFSGQLILQNAGMTDTDTLTALIAQAFEDVTGQVVGTITIPQFSGASGAVLTGAPQAALTTTQSIGSAVSGFFSGLTTTATALLIGIAALVVLVLVLAAYGPNVKHIAAAVA